ncbi:gp54 baseplate tail tube initiator [Acinetobacter phage Acj61]|uniref:Gp54 baseplate tail tube initiator n=1 Tax=Acinetobacter phage Acj61 TaxID=760732 RepID=E5E4I0_9CAUD|nr:tail tube [Acinetobacter phage Acj61]ADG36164.1 gp54 baseplate tail tube initiator [Acinetobacter phage Acj61]
MNGIAFTLDEFNSQVINADFQRTNMFSMVFATKPNGKTQELLNNVGNSVAEMIPETLDALGVTQGVLTQAITTVITMGSRKIVRKAGVSKVLIGAMTNRVFQSLLGELKVGTYLLDYFNMVFPTSGLMVQAVKIPDNKLNHEMDRLHNSPNIKITGRDFEPLVITFRMDSAAVNYRSMNDWVNSVEDPVTGLRALPSSVEADLQINLHARNGLPHSVVLFTGCVPVGVTSPQLSYEDNNQITTFDVIFAYRTMSMGPVELQAAKEWMEDTAIKLGKQAMDPNINLSSHSRLSGSANGIAKL